MQFQLRSIQMVPRKSGFSKLNMLNEAGDGD